MSKIALYLIVCIIPLYSAIGAKIGAWLAYRNRGGDK